MSFSPLCFAPIVRTTPLFSEYTLADSLLATAQGAASGFAYLQSATLGAVIGFAEKIAYKLSEYVLNFFFNYALQFMKSNCILSLIRKALELGSTAIITYQVLPYFVVGCPTSITPYVVFSCLENLRPLRMDDRHPLHRGFRPPLQPYSLKKNEVVNT